MGAKADRLRSLLRKADPIVDQAQRSSLRAEEVLTELEEREGREEARRQRAEAFARANRPVDVVAAGLLLDATHADGGGTAAARAAGLYATRIDSVNRAFTAAERFLDGEIDAAEFEAAVVEAGPGEVDHHGAHDHDEAPPADAPTPEDVSIDDFAPGTRELAHCLAVLEEIGRDLAGSDDLPAEVGAIDPEEACAGYDGTFSIADVAAAGALALWDGRERYELNVVGRHGASVEVRPAQRLPPGTFAVVLRPTAPSFRERLIDRAVVEDEECRPLVLQPPEGAPAEAPAVRLAIVGEPTVRLTANGHEHELVAPAGESVVLEWETRTEARGGVTTTLRAGDEVLMAEDAPSGRFVVRAHVPVAYTLSAEVELAGRRCGVGEATVLVRRRGGGTLTVRDRIYLWGALIPIGSLTTVFPLNSPYGVDSPANMRIALESRFVARIRVSAPYTR